MYSLVFSVALFFSLPYVLVRLASSRTRQVWLGRLGFSALPSPSPVQERCVWVHCSSVGEVRTVRKLLSRLSESLPGRKIVLSVMTATGRDTALDAGMPAENVFFMPLDHPWIIGKTIRKLDPEAVILVETELWPNLIRIAKSRGAKVLIVNARMSYKSRRMYGIVRPLAKSVMKCLGLVLAREDADAQRFVSLGADAAAVRVTGNMKYDSASPAGIKADRRDYGFGLNDRIFTAGSIREGEEAPVIDAYAQARRLLPALKCIIAPRHFDRLELIGKLLEKNGMRYRLKTSLSAQDAGQFDCLVVDTFGELMKIYSVSDAVFVGGSLVLTGGQNPLEPASLGRAVLFGPYMESFSEPARLLVESGGGIQVRDPEMLAEKVLELVNNPRRERELGQKAQAAVASMAGATERNAALVLGFLGRK